MCGSDCLTSSLNSSIAGWMEPGLALTTTSKQAPETATLSVSVHIEQYKFTSVLVPE